MDHDMHFLEIVNLFQHFIAGLGIEFGLPVAGAGPGKENPRAEAIPTKAPASSLDAAPLAGLIDVTMTPAEAVQAGLFKRFRNSLEGYM
jgi:hypothetical protein